MNYQLPQLPYAYNALEPIIDEQTMIIHHTKHHQAYIDKLNQALATKPELASIELTHLLKDLSKVPDDIRIQVQNNGGGHYNHLFFWSILSPTPQKPTGILAEQLIAQYGSVEQCLAQIKQQALQRFGSGWVWLVLTQDKKIEIMTTANQDSPLMQQKVPLIGIDVWEHAYYLKYQNKRGDYIDAIVQILNWNKINEIYSSMI
jgi:superoxide dismutase, Fe-Mn family